MKRYAAPRCHSCVMVYPSGERETMPRYTSQVRIWILSNKTFHPAAALFVDGVCRYPGNFPAATLDALKRELSQPPHKDTP